MTDKINIEEIKKYKNAVRADKRICYVCGAIDPECGMMPMVSVNVSREEISTDLCNDCYRKLWKEAEKSNVNPEDIWGLSKI